MQACPLTLSLAFLPQFIRCGTVDGRAETQAGENPSQFKIFLLVLTKHVPLVALVGISCMCQNFHTLLILTLHWKTTILHPWH